MPIRRRRPTSFFTFGRLTWLSQSVRPSVPGAFLETVSGRKIALLTGFGQKTEVIENKPLNPV